MDQNERYPFDVAKISKGDYIPPEDCEIVIGEERDSPGYRLGMMRVIENLQDQANSLGIKIKFICRDSGIAALTDSEAAEYLRQQQDHAVRKVYRMGRQMIGLVDQALLTPRQAEEHARSIAVSALRVQSLRGVGQKLLAAERKAASQRQIEEVAK